MTAWGIAGCVAGGVLVLAVAAVVWFIGKAARS